MTPRGPRVAGAPLTISTGVLETDLATALAETIRQAGSRSVREEHYR